ncbi:MAG: hypothetical protein HN337_03980 [Deltaproteobacteria bacterium]|jgi:hypothetical protein|nr:hypothetical protein [Deltaproteobacteria bacterium]
MKIKFTLFVAALLVLSGCGSPGSRKNCDGVGALEVVVKADAPFSPNIEHGLTEIYRVSISGDGIDEDMISEFSGDAEEGVVEDVSTGANREIVVEAINLNGVATRIGEAHAVRIGGGLNSVEVLLEPVPVFANLRDGGVIPNTRFRIRIFSDPSHPISIDGTSAGDLFPVVDAANNLMEVYSDESTWLGSLSPNLLNVGEYKFEARDLINGRSSSVTVTLIDGNNTKPAPFVAASSADRYSSSSISTNTLMEVIKWKK